MLAPFFAVPPAPPAPPRTGAVPASHTLPDRRRHRWRAYPSRRVRSCASGSPANAGAGASAGPASDLRDMHLVAVPMTAGGDVLFPGGSQLLSLSEDDASRVIAAVAGQEPPEFAYLPVNAWGEPAPVGTIAVVDDLQFRLGSDDSAMLCTGIRRFRVIHLSSDLHRARVELFWDDEPEDKELADLERLEKTLVDTMTQIVRLSIKTNEGGDERRQTALAETLRRVEAFCGNVDEEEAKNLLQHWIFDLSPNTRREVLSFVVIDLVSISFMDRRNLMMSTNTANRLTEALRCLEPFVKELAAKGAIISALGRNAPDDDSRATPPP